MATYVFDMYCVYAWLIYHECNTYFLHPDPQQNQEELYYALEEELIDNNILLQRNCRITLARTERPNNAPIEHNYINPVPELLETNSKNRDIDGTTKNYY